MANEKKIWSIMMMICGFLIIADGAAIFYLQEKGLLKEPVDLILRWLALGAGIGLIVSRVGQANEWNEKIAQAIVLTLIALSSMAGLFSCR